MSKQHAKFHTQNFVRKLYQNLGRANDSAASLKASADLQTINKIVRALPAFPHPLTHHFFGCPWQEKVTGLFKKRTQQFSASLIAELQWTVSTIAKFNAELEVFFDYREKCESSFLRGDFAESEKCREEIERRFGVSLWSLQQKFLHLEYTEGLEANTKYLSELNSTKDLHFFVQVLVTFLSMRAERHLSYDNYQYKLAKYLSVYDDHPRLKTFFNHVMGRPGLDFKDEDLILYILSDGSLIDRCLYTITLLNRLFIAQLEDSESLIPITELLCKKLKVKATRNLEVVSFPDQVIDVAPHSQQMLTALDKYTSGDYEEAAALSANLLLELPTSAQLYELLTKSLIFANKPLISPFAPNSPAHEVLSSIDIIYRKSEGYSQAMENLSRHAKSFHHTSLSVGLHCLIASECNPREYPMLEKLMLLDSQFVDPKVYLVASNRSAQQAIVQGLRRDVPNSLTIAFLSCYLGNSEPNSEIIFPSSLSEKRKLRYTAAALLTRGDFKKAIPILETLYFGKNEQDVPDHAYPLRDEIILMLYDAYIDADELAKAVDIYVQNMLANSLIVQGLDVLKLRSKLESSLHPELFGDIQISIFYAATINDPQAIFVPYDNFLTSLGCTRPTEFLSSMNSLPVPILVFFLKRVCIPQVMAGSYHITGTDVLENERLQILQHLCRIDQGNQALYSKEIDDITQRKFVRRGIRKSDEGKIHVDVDGIRKTGEKLLSENFRRYLDISSLKGIEKLKLLDTRGVKLTIAGAGTQDVNVPLNLKDLKILESEGVKVIFGSHYALFKDLFLDVRDRFILSSEYGLDSYLSVRIRHGTLQGQLRSRFEALHLVSQRNAESGEYQVNAFWEERLSACNVDQKLLVQTLLAGLSRALDEITKRVKDEIIQIKTETRPSKGLFDFCFDDKVLFDLFSKEFESITEYDEFMDRIFETLWKRTESSLLNVRNYISTELKGEFVQRLSDVQTELRKCVQSSAVSDLLVALTTSLTSIQNECDHISRWFTLTGVTFEAFTLREIVNVCVTSVNNVNPDVTLMPKIDVEDRKIAGAYFHSFFDILRALLDNAVRRSGLNGVAPQVAIVAKVENDRIVVKMSNTISTQVRASDPVKALRDRLALVRKVGVSEEIKKEGGTGYFKIAKLLQFDLKRQDSQITFEYPQETEFEVTLTFDGKELLL